MAKINKFPHPKGCWEWTGGRSAYGYGVFRSTFGESMAHRASFVLHKGPLMKGMCVLHKCDNPPCVNPEHLFAGDRIMNNLDKKLKGRTGRKWNALKTHCPHGHAYDLENTRFNKDGSRHCRMCYRLKARRDVAKRKEKKCQTL
jgi:hypothetical protein